MRDALRIGIPRALHGIQHYPLWRTFFEDLDAQVVLSPVTNRDIVSSGARVVADVTCLPVKVYAGHVTWLRDHGQIDFVFIPAIRSIEWGAMHCSKFQALPDLIRATLTDCPPLLETNIDAHRYKISHEQGFFRLGRQLTRDAGKIRRAWQHANQVDAELRAQMVAEKITYLEMLARAYPDAWEMPALPKSPSRLNIAMVGHPYCLYDDYINHNVVNRLRQLGVRVFTSEMVSPDDAAIGIQHTTGQKRWFYENWMSGAAGHYLHDSNIAGLVSVLAFTCGPDSAMVETISRRAHALNRPFMNLVLDEHGSAAGMITRLEAFVDMLARQATLKRNAPPIAAPAKLSAPVVVHHINKPRLGFPRMGTSSIPLKSLFENIGAQVELGPTLSARTVSLGARYSPEFICTPYKYILGNMIEMLESGADTLLYIDGAELCRNSSYTQLLNDVLHDLGYKFQLVSTLVFEKGGIFALPQFLRQFMDDFSWSEVLRAIGLALGKINALDAIERRVQQLRPREVMRGTVDKVWEEAQLRIDQVKNGDLLKRAQHDILQKLNQIEINPELRPVAIATTGEYYAVLEPFYNLDVERILGQLGAEVRRTIMLSDWVKLALIFDAIGLHKSQVEQAAKPYLRWNVGGEGLQTIGQAVHHAQKGADGLVELLPFTCIPEIAALNVLPRVSRDYNLPVMSFILDEQSGQAGMRTRLEAFVDLLQRRREIARA
jgi:predicted nucleotide-binding protein (sugar kinase/HSP70/actin superfamily)